MPEQALQKRVDLQTPLTEQAVRALQLGDHVYLTGTLFTGRSRFHRWIIDQKQRPEIECAAVNVMMHVGPVFRREADAWRVVSLDPTSSVRFEHWAPELIRRLGLRAIIGKTTMGAATVRAMAELGCVHLTRVGTPGNLLARCVTRVVDVFNLETFGTTEATWLLEVTGMGPFIVDIDANGRNLFDSVSAATASRLPAVYRRLGIAGASS